ncbi:MAG: ribulose-phosphate 3-epimerase [Clostridium sp.]|nr:ribulose-phosphate 3-epimerase [Clostridium sp.]MCM1444644.1 ribulose-phosphate 3-epimerase [Candidatus Amulumruptor caecigallinarius]
MLSVSILGVEDIKNKIKILDNLDVDYIHLDIMDGIFVNNKTWNINDIMPVLQNIKKPLDVHLMVKDVKKYIDDFKVLNPKFITFHLEVENDIKSLISYVKSLSIGVGIAINPSTSVDLLLPYLPFIDLVLVMSVEPGLGGQKFIETTIDKVNNLCEFKKKYNFLIEVDGGINNINIRKLNSDINVVGSYITKSDNYLEQINNLRKG